MKTTTVGKFKTHFSAVIEQVKAGEKIAVTYGKKKIVGYFLPEMPKRRLGILEGKAEVIFGRDFKMAVEEFLNYGLPT